MAKVSVIIPAYNAMAYLPETVNTVLKQTFEDYEIIIVNDGSTDNIQEWGSQISDPRIKLINQKNQGPALARNTGIAHSQSQYIAFLDADDLWDAEKLKKQVHVLDTHPEVGLVYTWVVQVDQSGKSTGRIFKNSIEGNVWEQLLERNFLVCGSTPMIRRSCLDEVGEFDPALFGTEDNDMWLRIATRYSFKVISEPLVYYRQYPSSVSKWLQKMEHNIHLLLEKASAHAPSYLSPTDLERLLNRSYGLKYLYLAWRALQVLDIDYAVVKQYSERAIKYYPSLRSSTNYIRFNIALNALYWLGPKRYMLFKKLLYQTRRGLTF